MRGKATRGKATRGFSNVHHPGITEKNYCCVQSFIIGGGHKID